MIQPRAHGKPAPLMCSQCDFAKLSILVTVVTSTVGGVVYNGSLLPRNLGINRLRSESSAAQMRGIALSRSWSGPKTDTAVVINSEYPHLIYSVVTKDFLGLQTNPKIQTA